MMRRTFFIILSFAIIASTLAGLSYITMALDKKQINHTLGLILMAFLVIFMIVFAFISIRFYKRNPQSLTYRISDLPFDIQKLPIQIQQQIKNKAFEEEIIATIETLFANNTPRTTSLLIAYAYFLYNYASKVVLDKVVDYSKKALKVLDEAKQIEEETAIITSLRKKIESGVK